MKKFAYLLLILILSTSDVFASYGLSISYDWDTSTIYEGGYDYTEVYYTYEENYEENGHDLQEPVEHYQELEGAELNEKHDLEIDSLGGYHIAFYLEQVGVMYAYREEKNGSWSYENIHPDSALNMYSEVKLELDSSNTPHIVFTTSNGDIYYSSKNGSLWMTSSISSNYSQRDKTFDVKIDQNDELHLFYESIDTNYDYHLIHEIFDITTKTTPYAVSNQTIDTVIWGNPGTAGQIGFINGDLKIDSKNNAQFIYTKNEIYGSTLRDIHYGYWDGTSTIVSNTGVTSISPRVKLLMSVKDEPRFITNSLDIYSTDQTRTTWSYSETVPVSEHVSDFDAIERSNGSIVLAHANYYTSGGSLIHQISYADYSNGNVRYFAEDVLTFVSSGSHVDLELESPLMPAVLYNDNSNPTYLQLTELNLDSKSDVDTTSQVGKYNDIDYDSNGLPHISYYDESNGKLMYAYRDLAGNWQTTSVDYSGDVGLYTSIDVDSNDNVHISYYSATNSGAYTTGNLKYANNTSGSWAYTNVDTPNMVGKYSSMLIDSSDTIHIAYYDETNENLLYTYGKILPGFTMPNTWFTPEIVNGTSSLSVGEYASMAMDSRGKLHISYYDATNEQLLVSSGTSGSWHTQVADSSTGSGEYSSIAIDSNDVLHIAYYNNKNQNLKYLTLINSIVSSSSKKSSSEIIDSDGNVGSYASLGMDDLNNAHISYYDASNKTLKYASNISGVWKTNTLDDASNTGLFTAIAVDEWFQVHISYFLRAIPSTSIANDLKYITL